MKFKLENLNVFITPKAEQMKEFVGIGWVEFEFPKLIKTVLFIRCGYIKNRKAGDDYYESIGRLYNSSNPRKTGKDFIGSLDFFDSLEDYMVDEVNDIEVLLEDNGGKKKIRISLWEKIFTSNKN